MKKITTLFMALFLAVAITSCSGDDDATPTTAVRNYDDIIGWWYPNNSSSGYAYKAYYFGVNGEYKQDMSNFGLGMGTGTWEWEDEDTLKMTPNPESGIVGGVQYVDVEELSADVLKLSMMGTTITFDRTE